MLMVAPLAYLLDDERLGEGTKWVKPFEWARGEWLDLTY